MSHDEGAAGGGLPHFDSGLVLGELDLHGGVFWEEVARFTAEAGLEALVAAVQAERKAPRIWAFLDTPENTASRAAAALSAARALARPGRKVLVLDADEQRPDLTRWADRFEQEGWIDFLRYGASLPACSAPLPWNGADGRFMGVGSFCPTQATPDEIWDLLARLRHRLDDILVSVPLEEAAGPWVAGADVRLLCWDGLTVTEAEAETMAADLTAAGAPVFGVVAFGSEAAALEAQPAEAASGEEVPEEAPEAAPQEPPAEAAGAPDAGPGETEVAAPAPEPGGGLAEEVAPLGTEPLFLHGPGAGREPAAGERGDRDGGDELAAAMARLEEDDAGAESAPTGRRRSSPLFWGAAAVLVAVIAVVGFTLVRNWGASGPATEPPLAQVQRGEDISTPPEPAPARPGEPTDAAGDVGPARDGAESTGGDRAGTDRTDTSGEGAAPGEPIAAGDAGTAAQPAETTEMTETPPEAPPEAPPTAAEPVDAAADDPWAAFRGPVGEGGWALHLYSFPDSAAALREVEELRRRRFTAVVRGQDLPGKGRWFRVYVGSFASRAAAREAMPALLERLREDWAQPVRF